MDLEGERGDRERERGRERDRETERDTERGKPNQILVDCSD